MHTEVSFTSDRDQDPDIRRASLSLAENIVAGLTGHGFTCSVIEDIDYAHTFRVVVGTRNFYVLVGRVDDGIRQWLVSTNSGLNRLRRILGERDHDEHRVLTGVLHDVLDGDPAIGDIRWYTLTDWNESPDDRWSATPDG